LRPTASACAPVGHGAREDQAGKGYFLIGDGVADFIFGHWWLREFERWLWRESIKSRGGGMVELPYFVTGIGWTPDNGRAVLRSRIGRNYRQLPTSER
jgi:hypothetical protein